ncbi:MAG: hypothetical protein ABIR24_14885 [Verrucomicrobiota bacterium]
MTFKLTNALVVCATFAAVALGGCATNRNLWRDLERAGRPSSDELQTTQFALIGEMVAPEGRFYVAVQRLVRREMLAPRGQQNLLLFDAKRRLAASYSLATATPLWCESSRVYLWGDGIAYNVPVDPRIYALYAEESAEGGNVIEFSRGIHKPYITREMKYGSSGGIENDPWQVEKKQPDATANQSQPIRRPLKEICSVCGARMFSAEPQDVDADSLDSDLKTFHHYGIQNHAESYLVCLHDVEKTGGPKNEAEIKATVVDRIKGEKRVGEEFVFRRVSDSSFEQLLRMRGGLYYVFLNKEDDEKMTVDGQDPAALRKYSDELREMVHRHKQRL